MTIEEARTFLDNLKVCIKEHPIVADWLVEIADRKTEPQTENLFTDKYGDVWEWRGDAWYCISGQDEPQTCEECEHWSDTEDGCADRHGCKTEPYIDIETGILHWCGWKYKRIYEDEPQTELNPDLIDKPIGHEVISVEGTLNMDEPQADWKDEMWTEAVQTDCTTCEQVGRCERGRAVDCPLTERSE